MNEIHSRASSFIVPKRRLRIRLIDEVRNADAGQSIEPVGREIEAAEEIEGEAGEMVAAGGRGVVGVGAGGGAEVAGAKLHRHGATREFAFGQRGPQRMRFVADV